MNSLSKPLGGCCSCLALIGAAILLLSMVSGGVKRLDASHNAPSGTRSWQATAIDASQKRLYWVDASTKWSKIASLDPDKMVKDARVVAAREGESAGEAYLAKELDKYAIINLEASEKLRHANPPADYVQLNKSLIDSLAANAKCIKRYAAALRKHDEPAIAKEAKAVNAVQNDFGQLVGRLRAQAAEVGIQLQ